VTQSSTSDEAEDPQRTYFRFFLAVVFFAVVFLVAAFVFVFLFFAIAALLA
jgi:hypothetical protein